MNPLANLMATVQGQPGDRVPVIAQVFGHTAALAGVNLNHYLTNGELLARCQIRAAERYQHDAVFAVMDSNVETEALGSRLSYSPCRYPVVETYAIASPAAMDRLAVPDPTQAGRMPEMLQAIRTLRHEYGDHRLVVGCVLGPMTLASQLMGLEDLLYLAADAPEQYTFLLDFAVEVGICYGLAQLEAGAHLPLLFDPASSPSVIPPALFRSRVLPRLARLIEAFRRAGAPAAWLHIAGPTTPILPLYADIGVDIANFDYEVTVEQAVEALPNTCLDGNLRPLDFVQAPPERIAEDAARLVTAFAPRGRFILSSGCEIPPQAKSENIEAMVQAARAVKVHA